MPTQKASSVSVKELNEHLLHCADLESRLNGIVSNLKDESPRTVQYIEAAKTLRETTLELFLRKIALECSRDGLESSHLDAKSILAELKDVITLYKHLETAILGGRPPPISIQSLQRQLRMEVARTDTSAARSDKTSVTAGKSLTRTTSYVAPTKEMLRKFANIIGTTDYTWDELLTHMGEKFGYAEKPSKITKGVLLSWCQDIYTSMNPETPPPKASIPTNKALTALLVSQGVAASDTHAEQIIDVWRQRIEEKAKRRRAETVRRGIPKPKRM